MLNWQHTCGLFFDTGFVPLATHRPVAAHQPKARVRQRAKVNTGTLLAICDATNASMDWLMTGRRNTHLPRDDTKPMFRE